MASFSVPKGPHTPEWRYSNNGSLSAGQDRGWVDWVLYSMDFKTALDNQSLNFTSGGYAGWIGQTKDYLIGGSSARSPLIPDSQLSWLQTTVTGPGNFSFDWKVSSEANFEWLKIYLDNTELDSISGEKDWQPKTLTIPAGTHLVWWAYIKGGSQSKGMDAGWVDMVEFRKNSGSLGSLMLLLD